MAGSPCYNRERTTSDKIHYVNFNPELVGFVVISRA